MNFWKKKDFRCRFMAFSMNQNFANISLNKLNLQKIEMVNLKFGQDQHFRTKTNKVYCSSWDSQNHLFWPLRYSSIFSQQEFLWNQACANCTYVINMQFLKAWFPKKFLLAELLENKSNKPTDRGTWLDLQALQGPKDEGKVSDLPVGTCQTAP